MKLLGIKIHHNYHSEAKVYSGLLKYRENHYEALTYYNGWKHHSEGREQFEKDSQSQVIPYDMGWRPQSANKFRHAERFLSVGKLLIAMRRLASLARRYNPDVIYSSQQTWDNLTATHIARKLGKPQIIHLHYVPGITNTTNYFQQKAIDNLKTCDCVITVSEFIQHKVVEYGASPERVFPIMNTIPLPSQSSSTVREEVRQELGLPEGVPLIGIVGRVEQWKGQHDTIAAFSQIADQFPRAHLLVVGEGDYLDQAKLEAHQSGFGDRIHLLGLRKDVPRLLAALDVFSHPSRLDPAPLAVLEACAAGLPVVAYSEGGVCEMIVSGKTGYLVQSGKIPELSGAIAQLLADPQKAKEMGRANQERMATYFRPEDAGERFAQILQTVVSRHH